MGENDETANLFKNEYRAYAFTVVKTAQETTGVSLAKLLDALQ